MTDADARLEELLSLPPGWDGGRGKPVSVGVAIMARSCIGALAQADLRDPQIVPLADGGLQLEWHSGGFDIEMRIARAAGSSS